MQIVLNNEEDTKEFARRFYEKLRGGEAIGLIGDLGTGKTTFVRYLAGVAGVPISEVSSPSFVLGYEYKGNKFIIDHWDIYRLFEEPEELLEPPAKNVIRLIEWADRSKELESELDIVIKIEFLDLEHSPNSRLLTIEFHS